MVADPDDNNVLERPRYQYQYDERGNQTAIIDPLNQTTTFTFTSRGQQESRTLPLGFTESFTYDDQGRQLTHTSFEGVVTENEYDATGRLSKMRYSRNGTLLETREFAFDEYGRNVGNVLKDAAGTVTRIEETIFDSRGRILFEKSPEGILGYGYDNAGRMSYTAVFGGVGFQPENPPSLTDAIRVTHYGYDILGRLVSVQEDITPAITTDATQDTAYTFDLHGRMDTTELPNGVTSDYDYDALGRLDTQTDTDAAGNVLAAYDYEVRADGKRDSLEETFWFDANLDGLQTADELKTTSYNWTYDDVGRLTDEVLDHWDNSIDRAEHFEYDLTGNRTKLSTDLNLDGIIDDLVTYHYDANDRLITELLDTGNNGTTDQTTAYTYDQTQQKSKSVVAAGLTTSRQTFTYNLQGRMNAVINDGFDASGTLNARERTSYTYDSRSFRINLTNETTSDFVSDPTDVTTWTLASRISFLAAHNNHTGYTQTIRETTTNADGTTKTIDYTFGHDEISQRVVERNAAGDITSDTTHIFGHDGHGSVRMLTDLAGTIAQVYTFAAYGSMLAVHNSAGLSSPLASRLSSLGYSGEHFDAKAQQQYLRARFYNPANGRFNRLDPFAGNNTDPQSFHKYAYTHGDPVNGIDPTGMFSVMSAVGGIGGRMGLFAAKNPALFGAITGGVSGGIDGYFENGSWKDAAIGAGTGALFGAIFGRIGGAVLSKLGPWMTKLPPHKILQLVQGLFLANLASTGYSVYTAKSTEQAFARGGLGLIGLMGSGLAIRKVSQWARKMVNADTLALAWTPRDGDIFGVDSRAANVIRNNISAAEMGSDAIADNAALIANQADLPLPDRWFQNIVGRNVQIPIDGKGQFVGDAGRKTFQEWFRVLKPGGRVEVSIAKAAAEDVTRELTNAGFDNVTWVQGVRTPPFGFVFTAVKN